MTVATTVFFARAALTKQAGRTDRHHGVTVDDLSALVDDDQSVGVAIERDADVRLVFEHLAGQVFGVQRAAL